MPPRKPSIKKPSLPVTMIIYGPSGSGKTSLAAHFPSPGFLCDNQERGIEFLTKTRQVPKPVWVDTELDVDSHKSWKIALEKIWNASRDKTIKTLVVESITGFENMCFLSHCYDEYNNDYSKEGFLAYAQGPKSAARFSWPEMIAALDAVNQAGKHVIVTAHAHSREEANPEGTAVLKWVPYAQNDIWARIHRWASAVFFLGQNIQEDTRNKKTIKKIARPEFDRLLYTEATPYCAAKNWYGLHGVLNLGESPQEGYEALKSALSKQGVVL